MRISGLPLGSPKTKCHLDVGLVEKHTVNYKGEGGGFPQVWAVMSLVNPSLPMVSFVNPSLLVVNLVNPSLPMVSFVNPSLLMVNLVSPSLLVARPNTKSASTMH